MIKEGLKELGKIYATTFDNQVYVFSVKEDNKVYLMDVLNRGQMDNSYFADYLNKPIDKMILKSRFILYGEETYILNSTNNNGLIMSYEMDINLEKYLLEHNMITFTPQNIGGYGQYSQRNKVYQKKKNRY